MKFSNSKWDTFVYS